jgi:hypothetical protein
LDAVAVLALETVAQGLLLSRQPPRLQASCEDTEADFWRVVENGNEPVEVLCATDLDAAALNCAFPEVLQNSVALLQMICCSTASAQCRLRAGCSSCDEVLMQGQGAAWSDSPWSLASFPQLQGNMMRHAGADSATSSRSHLDIGMMFSSTAWRLAPQLQYTASYLHTGAPKKW